MPHKKTHQFLEEVLDQREDLIKRAEEGLARKLQYTLKRTRTKILEEIETLRIMTDEDGNLVNNQSTILTKQRVVENIDDLLNESEVELVKKLGDAKAGAFRKGVLEIKMAIDRGTPDHIELDASFRQIFTQAAKYANSAPVLGVTTEKAFKGVKAYTKSQVRTILTENIIRGETIGDTAKKISQVMDINERAATRIARTNINAAQNMAHRMVYEQNDDVFKGYRWDATFDSRTSAICAHLHGTFYPLGSNPPGPPAHPNCRSTLIGVFKDKEVQDEIDNSERRVRSTATDKNKLIPARENFEQWLRDETPEAQKHIFQTDIKTSLWRSRKVSLEDLMSDDLSIRDDKEIVARALGRRPKDAQLKKLAKELGVKKKTKTTALHGDLSTAGKVPWSVGTRPGQSKEVRERREAIDERKETIVKDQINRLAARAAKKSG